MGTERILVVDDEPGVRSALLGILRDEGFEVEVAESGEEGLRRLTASPFDAVLLDVWLPGKDGLETLVEMRDRRIDAEVVMISGHGTIETAVRATRLGAFDFIEKPLSLERTLLVLRNALRQRRLERRNRKLLEQLERDTEVLGASAAAERIRIAISAAAGTDAPVLVVGERGTGRELVARRIHASGSRAGEAFVSVPCAALDAVAASEALFGDGQLPGRIRLAARGTLFLEDSQLLDDTVQTRLAAALASRGDGATDVRIVASVAPGLDGLSADLLRILDVVRVEVAPLRERREDVPLLAERFLRELSREYGRPQKRFTPEGVAALVRYDWPGNVRELRNLIERIVLQARGASVGVGDLPEALGGLRHSPEDLYGDFDSLTAGIETFERYYVRRVLVETLGDREAAARRLGVDLAALEGRVRDLGLA